MKQDIAHSPFYVVKRDGGEVPFDAAKIGGALSRCYAAIGRPTPEGASASVVSVLAGKYGASVTVEQVQDAVETVLLSIGEREAAKAYMAYRDAHAERRRLAIVTPELRAAYEAGAAAMGNDPLRTFQFFDKYSRWNGERRETWPECVDRAVEHLRWLVIRECGTDRFTEGEWMEIRDAIRVCDALPSMRLLSQAGAAARRDDVSIFNCFTGDEEFLTPSGPAALSNHVGDVVSVRCADGAWRNGTVAAFGVQEVVRVRVRHYNGGKSGNFVHEIKVTPNHRWLLLDGSETTKLCVGDKLASPPVDVQQSEEGWRHGFVFGDGALTYSNGQPYCQIRLCGKKARHLTGAFAEFGHSFPPSCDGDPFVYLGKDRVHYKSLPDANLVTPEYVAGFVAGLCAADGSLTSCGNLSIHSQNDEAVAWLERFAPLGGYKLLSKRTYAEPTNYGPRSAPLRTLVLGKAENAILRVESIEYVGEQEVFCVVEPETRTFTLGNGQVTGNCSFQVIDSLECFRESLLISMAGAGDAYSVESQFIRELPLVRHQRGLRADTHVVEDTSEGWADALMVGLTRWFDGADVVFDYSALRPAGAILRTKGGRASGPAPLRTVLRLARSLVLSRQGSQLRPVDVNDLLCATGEAGNSGGMRRTAKLSLSDWGDTEMQDAKGRPGWWDTHPYRENANNSAVWPDGGPSQLDLIGQFQSMYTARSGERGIFSRENALRTMPAARAEYLRRTGGACRLGTNSCAEIYLQSESFCNLSQGVARPGDTVESLRRKVRLATRMGTIQSLATRYRYLRASWGEHGREERLLGVDVTGQMDCPILRDGCPDAVLRQLRAEARAQNAADAERLGIRPSMAITCNKPSGNSSAFLDAAPGINARKIRYGIRNARVSAASPIFRVLKACGVPMDPENGQQADTATKWVIHFPMAAPEGSVIESERSALQQLDHWLLNKRNWTEHNPSVTVTYSPDEMIGIIGWVWEHRTEVGGVSFLPRADTVYRQMPYEETTRAEYEQALAAFPRIDWALIAAFEAEDMTTSSQELACGGGKCESV